MAFLKLQNKIFLNVENTSENSIPHAAQQIQSKITSFNEVSSFNEVNSSNNLSRGKTFTEDMTQPGHYGQK